MKILSVNVGLPREVSWQGKLVTTGIFKDPVDAPIMLRTLDQAESSSALQMTFMAHPKGHIKPIRI